MAYTNYKQLKSQGDEGEQQFISFLESKGYTDIQTIDELVDENPSEYNHEDFDVQATNSLGVKLKFEVKTQEKCHTFGYHNVEQVQNGVPGGIAVSKSDYWVFVNEKLGFGFIEANELKKTHYQICKDPTINKQSYHDKVKVDDNILWITKFKNFAAGWRQPNNKLEWYKQTN